MRFSHDYFWGLLFIVAGIAFIVRYALHIDIPVIRILIGFIFVYIGVSIIFGGIWVGTRSDIILNKGRIDAGSSNGSYNVVFSNGTIDFTKIPPPEGRRKVEVNVVFGKGIMRIDPQSNMIVKINSAFASAESPDNSNVTFGEHIYSTKNYNPSGDYLEVDVNVVFGKLDIVDY